VNPTADEIEKFRSRGPGADDDDLYDGKLNN